MELFLRDGTPLETTHKPTSWQLQNLSYNASGYGNKIPTGFMVKHNKRWKRVYCRIFSNSGTLYIMAGNAQLIIN
jgi:hypothetical protein